MQCVHTSRGCARVNEMSTCVPNVRARVSLTVCALHLGVVARLYEADVAQVEDASDDLQHLSLDVPRDSNHLHGFLETSAQKEKRESGEQRKPSFEDFCLYFFDRKLPTSVHVTSSACRSVLGPKSDLISSLDYVFVKQQHPCTLSCRRHAI